MLKRCLASKTTYIYEKLQRSWGCTLRLTVFLYSWAEKEKSRLHQEPMRFQNLLPCPPGGKEDILYCTTKRLKSRKATYIDRSYSFICFSVCPKSEKKKKEYHISGQIRIPLEEIGGQFVQMEKHTS